MITSATLPLMPNLVVVCIAGAGPRIGEIVTPVSIFYLSFLLFTALYGMQTRSCDEISVRLSVRPSVRLSNTCIVTKRKKSQSRFLYHAIDNLV